MVKSSDFSLKIVVPVGNCRKKFNNSLKEVDIEEELNKMVREKLLTNVGKSRFN